MIYLKEHTHIYRLSTEKDGTRTLISEHNSSIPAEVKRNSTEEQKLPFQGKTYTALCTDTRGWTWAGTADGLELFIPDEQTPRIFIVKMD